MTERPRSASGTRVLALWEHGGASFVLRPYEQVTIGRHLDCEVRIDLPSVSRRHARLTASASASGEPAMVEDIGGMNGVRVRGQRIVANLPTQVLPGDVIELGGALLLFYAETTESVGGPLARAVVPRVSWSDNTMQVVERLFDAVGESDVSALIVGEAGTGRTTTAETLHARSNRRARPLIQLDCAALPEPKLERELFGYDGSEPPRTDLARTMPEGIKRGRAGALEKAFGGTVVLEAVGEMTLGTQDKLLEVLRDRAVRRLASSASPAPIDVRLVGVTHRHLPELVASGRFRRELYEALSGVTLIMPPLRDRVSEVPHFAAKFLNDAAARMGRPRLQLSSEALGVLVRHPFHNNLRELKTTMERACVLARGSYVGREHLVFEHFTSDETAPAIPRSAISTARFAPISPTEAPDAPPSGVLPPVVIPAAPRTPSPAETDDDPRRPRKR